jgi:BlaI family penicillinase repressor
MSKKVHAERKANQAGRCGSIRARSRVPKQELSRRERQVMDVVYAGGRVTVADVQQRLPDRPTYSATRMLLQRLHKKGLLTFVMEGPRYVYSATAPKSAAGREALARLVRTFFDGSKARAVSALLGTSPESLSDAEIGELEKLVQAAKARRR